MTLYLFGSIAYGFFLLLNKISDRECSKTDPIYWLLIAIASSLWVVVIPISLLEITSKAKAKPKSEPIDEKASADNNCYLETSASVS